MIDYCTLSPDKIFKYDISSACKQHDRDYYNAEKFYHRGDIDLSGYHKLRKEFDKQFLLRLKKILPKYLHFIAYIYYYAVRMFGGYNV